MLFAISFLQVTLVKMVNEATANIPNWGTEWTYASHEILIFGKRNFLMLFILLEWFIYKNLRLNVFSKREKNIDRK